jgi:hypothetical protein
MRVLVCGDHNWLDRETLFARLDELHARTPFSCVIEGEARGADSLARIWAEERKVPVEKFPARWSRYGRALMLEDGKPELVVAFHKNIDTSKGTRDMLKISADAGIKTLLFQQ